MVAFAAAVAYTVLVRAIIRVNRDSVVARAIGSDPKGMASLAAYAAAIGFAFLSPWISYGLYVAVATMWFIPDRRLSRTAKIGA
jgi:hypothetical protein